MLVTSSIARGLGLQTLPPDNKLTVANAWVAQLDPDSLQGSQPTLVSRIVLD
jgi:hypothetical protein